MEQLLMLLLIVLTVFLPIILLRIVRIMSICKQLKNLSGNLDELKDEDDYGSITVNTDNKLIRKLVFY